MSEAVTVNRASRAMKLTGDYCRNCGRLRHRCRCATPESGFWSHEGWRDRADGAWFGTTTIQALVSRGVAQYSDWKETRSGRFPIAVEMAS